MLMLVPLVEISLTTQGAFTVHTSVVGHQPTSADIVARVEAMSTFVHRRRQMRNDASMNEPLKGDPWYMPI